MEFSSQINPLLLDIILKRIFNFFRSNIIDLKTFRLVHSTWNEAATSILKQTCKITLRPGSTFCLNVDDSDSSSGGEDECEQCEQSISPLQTIENFMPVAFNGIKLFGRIPFSQFKLIDFPFESDQSETFFNLVGTEIKSIDIRVKVRSRKGLDFSKFDGSLYGDIFFRLIPFVEKVTLFPFPNNSIVKSNISIAQPNLPCLQRIHFKEWTCKFQLYELDFLSSLFKVAINLKEIWISIGVMDSQSVENILNGLWISERYNTITNLHFGHLQTQHLEALIKLPLKLGVFRVEFFYGDFENIIPLFEIFLHSQRNYLKELYFRVGSKPSNSFRKLNFPQLKNLITLDCDINSKIINKFSFKDNFKTLQSLRVHGNFNERFDFHEFLIEDIKLKSVKSLHFRPGIDVSNLIKGLAKVFPSVSNLTISVNQMDDFEDLWKSFLCLEHLTIYYGKNVTSMDSAIIGLSVEDCESIRTSLAVTKNFMDDKWISSLKIDLFKSAPSILKLNDLKTLRMEFNDFFENESPLSTKNLKAFESSTAYKQSQSYLPTDLSGWLAFQKMTSLQSLTLKECRLSKECCESLTKSLELSSWSFTYEGDEIIPPKY